MHIRSQTTLFFIRHGETLSNANGIKQGNKINEYLDTQGILQVKKMGAIVKHLDLDVLYTSHLHRAEESAAIIDNELPLAVPIMHDFRLRERDFGTLTGKKEAEWDKLLPSHALHEELQTYDYRPFGGESVEQVRQRAMGAILDLIENYEHHNVGIITHAGIIRLLLFHFPDIPRIYHADNSGEFNIANTDIYEWEITNGKIANIKSLLK